MATVTGLTAERMLEIEAESVIGAMIDGAGHLILSRHDGTPVDAGLVVVPGPRGPAGLSLIDIPTQSVLDVGMVAQVRAGRSLSVADFTTLCKLPTTPAGLFGLSDLANQGSGVALTNKGAVPFGAGILGLAGQAAQFKGDPTQLLYISDIGAADPFRIRTGSIGCWFRTTKRGTFQSLISKAGASGAAAVTDYILRISDTNVANLVLSDGTTSFALSGTQDVCDDRWHFVVATHDGVTAQLYVDGVLEAQVAANVLIQAGAYPFNLGGYGGDAATAPTSPNFGRIDEAFVTTDILSDQQVRLLYCAKIPHGYATTPKLVILNVHNRRKGAALVSADFPTAPARLYNLTDLNDLGSNNVPLTANAGTGAIIPVPGPDGTKDTARNYSGAHAGDSGTDAGLPAATTARTYGVWLKTRSTTSTCVFGWGTLSTGDARLVVTAGAASQIQSVSAADTITGPVINDGLWHHVVVVEDNAATNGLRRKLYVDGKLQAASTVLASIVLAGANRFRIGANPDGTAPFSGQVARAFVHPTALTSEQIRALYYKSGQDLGAAPKNPGDHVKAFDATNVYAAFDTIEGQNLIDMSVAA